jgi:hypothetical protein
VIRFIEKNAFLTMIEQKTIIFHAVHVVKLLFCPIILVYFKSKNIHFSVKIHICPKSKFDGKSSKLGLICAVKSIYFSKNILLLSRIYTEKVKFSKKFGKKNLTAAE